MEVDNSNGNLPMFEVKFVFLHLWLVGRRRSTRNSFMLMAESMSEICPYFLPISQLYYTSHYSIFSQACTYLQPLLLLSLPLPRPSFPALLVQRSLILLRLRNTLGMACIFIPEEIPPTVYAGKHLTVGTLVLIMFLHLVLFQGSATRTASEEHHLQASTRRHHYEHVG